MNNDYWCNFTLRILKYIHKTALIKLFIVSWQQQINKAFRVQYKNSIHIVVNQ